MSLYSANNHYLGKSKVIEASMIIHNTQQNLREEDLPLEKTQWSASKFESKLQGPKHQDQTVEKQKDSLGLKTV